MIIKLRYPEILLGAQAGVMRKISGLKNKRPQAYGLDQENHWQIDIEGALGEMALAKYLNLYWQGKGKVRDFDVGGKMEVKTVKSTKLSLILHKDYPDDYVYWLMIGIYGSYEVAGWIYGRDGKQEKYYKDPKGGRPAYFVPTKALNPPTTPRKVIHD